IAGKYIDIGSNDREFWMYVKQPMDDDNFFYCAHDDFERGNVRLPIPFDTDWVLMALGMKTYSTTDVYETRPVEREGALLLSQKTTTRQGQPVVKNTIFNVEWDEGRRPAVRGHMIYDSRGTLITSASIKNARTITVRDPATGRPARVQIPTSVVLDWPTQKFSMEMVLKGEKVNEEFTAERAAQLFRRPTINGSSAIDLATYQFRPSARSRGQAPSR
ncbi:MAG: hypothetical protein ACRCZF_01930, partial [Gemmataceae bacterium]